MTDKTGYWTDDAGNRRYGHFYVNETMKAGLFDPFREVTTEPTDVQDITTEPDNPEYERQKFTKETDEVTFNVDGFTGQISGLFFVKGREIIGREVWDPTEVLGSVETYRVDNLESYP